MHIKLLAIFRKVSAHAGFRKYFANTFWLFAEQALRLIAGIFVSIYVARYLGPEGFGLLSYAIAFVAMFAAVAKLGLDGVVVRGLVREPEKRDQYIGTAFRLKVIGAALAMIAILIAAVLIEDDGRTILYISVIASGLFFQASEVADFYFQSRVQSKFVSLARTFQLSVSSLLKLYLVATGAELQWFVLVSAMDQVMLAAALAYAYSRQAPDANWFRYDRALAGQMLRGAAPMLVSGIMVAVYTSVDRVIIKEMLGVREVGLYTAAVSLVTALYFIPMLAANSLFPALLNAKARSGSLYLSRLSMQYKYSLSLGLVVCLIFTLVADSLIGLLFGRDYAESSAVLQIYAWNFMVICFSAVFGKWLLSENLQSLMPRFTLMAVSVNIAGCLLLIPRWSINGAAVAALAAQLIPLVWFGLTNKEIQGQLRCAFSFR